jgi:hypothetical protein
MKRLTWPVGRAGSRIVLVWAISGVYGQFVIVVVNDEPGRWTASRGADMVGRLHAFVRPNPRCFLFLDGVVEDGYGPLVDAALGMLDGDLYIEAATGVQREVRDADRHDARWLMVIHIG